MLPQRRNHSTESRLEMLKQIQDVEREGSKDALRAKVPAETFRVRTWLLSVGVAALGLLVITLVPQRIQPTAHPPEAARDLPVASQPAVKAEPELTQVLPSLKEAQTSPVSTGVEPAASGLTPAQDTKPSAVTEPASSKKLVPADDKSSRFDKSRGPEKLKRTVPPLQPMASQPDRSASANKSELTHPHLGHGSEGGSAVVHQAGLESRAESASAVESSSNAAAHCATVSGLRREQCLSCSDRNFFGRLSCDSHVKTKFCEVRHEHPDCAVNPYQ